MLLNPIVFCILVGVYVPLAFITRIVSLASILGAITFPFATYFVLRFQGRPYVFDTVFAAAGAALVVYMHRANIKRLLNGTEARFGEKK